MLIQIGQNSATLAPFGSLGSGNHNHGADDGGHEGLFRRRSNAIRLAWR